MAALNVPALASAHTKLYLGGATSPPSYVFQSRMGDIKFNGVSIDMVDVQQPGEHRAPDARHPSEDRRHDR